MNGTRAPENAAFLPGIRPTTPVFEAWQQVVGGLQKSLGRFLHLTGKHRDTFFLVGDGLTAIVATSTVHHLVSGISPSIGSSLALGGIAGFLVILANLLLGNYRLAWVTFSLSDLRRLAVATGLVTLVLFGLKSTGLVARLAPPSSMLWGMSLFLALAAFRGSKRLLVEPMYTDSGGKRTLVVMSSRHAYFLPNMLRRLHDFRNTIVGIVDPDRSQVGSFEQGIEVLGTTDDIEALVEKYRAEAVIVMLETDPGFNLGDFYSRLHRLGRVEVKTMPSLLDVLEDRSDMGALEKLCIHELTGRPPVTINVDQLSRVFSGRRILVTGAGGSIGSELCRQLARFNPSRLVLFERDDTNLFYVDRELRRNNPDLDVVPFLGDLSRIRDLERCFAQYRPELVFHAAAYKHVPILEFHAADAVRTNVIGTHQLANIAVRYGAECLVYISTDKAVNPTSLMGATKRLGEMVATSMNGLADMRTIAVRFGNVLDSRGSVTTLFREAIAKRQPLHVTHRDMKRYFMLTSEAVLLVLQAAAQGRGGEVFVLDMGEPVRIWDLAHRMVELAGLTPNTDVPIVEGRMRPGEKLFEELLTAEEGTVATEHDRIKQCRISRDYCYPDLLESVRHLDKDLERLDPLAVKKAVSKLVPNYRPDPCTGLRPACNLACPESKSPALRPELAAA